MTAEDPDDEQVAQHLSDALEAEADGIEVKDGWEALSARLLNEGSDPSGDPNDEPSPRRHRRPLGGAGLFLGIAAAIATGMLLGSRPAVVHARPVGPATSARRFAGSVPALVVDRPPAGAGDAYVRGSQDMLT